MKSSWPGLSRPSTSSFNRARRGSPGLGASSRASRGTRRPGDDEESNRMKNLPPALAAHLATGATTLCRCWRLTRRDGIVRGFCTIDLDDQKFRGEGDVSAVEGASLIRVSGLDAFTADWFARGKLIFFFRRQRRHRRGAGEVRLALWQQMPEPVVAGDLFVVTAGCDKRFETCRTKFDNAVNFRGFPHLPGNDFVVAYAVPGEPGHDGTPLR